MPGGIKRQGTPRTSLLFNFHITIFTSHSIDMRFTLPTGDPIKRVCDLFWVLAISLGNTTLEQTIIQRCSDILVNETRSLESSQAEVVLLVFQLSSRS